MELPYDLYAFGCGTVMLNYSLYDSSFDDTIACVFGVEEMVYLRK